MRHKLLMLLAGLMMTVASFAGKEELYVLYEGFESDSTFATWSQENVLGNQAWAVEPDSVAKFPIGAFEGNYRAALRNTSSQTQHFVTRLVSPVMDISETFRPILVFAHAQAQRTGDFDTLRVYYRTSAEGRWVKLKEFDEKITKWQLDTIALPAQCATYQIAFEGTDNYGRGIALDEVIVRPEPTCETANNISFNGLTVNSVDLQWIGSFDTDSFHVVLSTAAEDPASVVLDTMVYDFGVQITGLIQNTKYYVAIQANCGVEQAEWAQTSFTTKNQVNVPYVQDFNMEYAAGTISHVDYWTHGTSIKKEDLSMEFMPFINQNTADASLKNYSYSNTTCLVFTGAHNTSSAIPAGEYVYAATPEINIERIQDAQAEFWGTVYTYYNNDMAAGLIVGVMTDPSDFTTFVPVDTVYIQGAQTFDRFTVYFSDYKGDGKYIAFVSNFTEKDNIFYMDDLTIKSAPAVKAPTNVSVFNTTSTSLMVNANMNGESASKLYITKHTVNPTTQRVLLDPTDSTFGAENIIATYDVTAFPYKVELPATVNGQFVQVYVQNIKGEQGSDFPLPIKQLIPMRWDGVSEFILNFDTTTASKNYTVNELKNFWNNSASYTYPYEMITDVMVQPGLSSSSTIYTVRYPLLSSAASKYHSAKGAVYLKRDRRVFGDGTVWVMPHGQYIALPEIAVADIADSYIQFYSASYSNAHPEAAGVYVGMMTDPFDANTFDTIALVTTENDFRMALVSFADYKGAGTFPAIMAATMLTDESWSGGSGSGSGSSYKDYYMSATWIDDISYLKKGGCMPATALKAENISFDKATLVWNANEMDEWIVKVYKDAAKKDTLLSDTVKVNSLSLDSLMPHTTYWFEVIALCGGKEYPSDLASFKTICRPSELIPYTEDFENYTGGSTTQDLPACWTIQLQKYTYSGSGESSTSWYPYIYNYEATAHAGKKCFYFCYSSSTTGVTPSMVGKPSVAVLPLMSERLDTLQLSFWMKAGGSALVNDTVYVGVMSDPEDISTFDTIQLIKSTLNYTEYIVRLENYKGKGKYIAFMKTARESSRSLYIDDVKVDFLANCEKIQGVAASNFHSAGATISWVAQSSSLWEMVVTDKSVADPAAAGTNLVQDTIVAANPFSIDFCPETNKEYFVYVRAICDESNKGEWSNEISFKTTCVAQSAAEYGLIDFAEKDFKTNKFPCWTVGRREGTTAVPSITDGSYLYMFNSATSEGAYAIMPPIDIDSINRLQVRFTAAGGTGAAYLRELTVGIITNPNDLSTFTPLETVKLPLVATTISKANHTKNLEEAQTYVVRFNDYFGDYEGNYGKQIMFISENGGVANYVYIYSMQVDTIPSCWEPINIDEVEVNTYDATMAWDSISNNYEVQLLNAKKEVIADTLVANNSIKFEGLDMLTSYYMQVRTICGIGDTSFWSPMAKFTTQCPVAYELPYEENFDAYTAKTTAPRVQPNCWTTWFDGQDAVTASTAYCYIYATAKKGTTGNGFYMGSTTGNAAGTTPAKQSLVVLPAMNGLQTGLLHFNAKAANTTGTRALKIGMAEYNEPYDSILSSVVWIDSVEDIAGKDWTYYTFDLATYKGAGKHIVIMNYGGNLAATSPSTSGQYVYIDDIYVEKAPSCFRPIDAAFQSATANSLTFSWKPQGEEKQWDVVVVEKDSAIAESFITVDTIPATVTGLQDSKEYDFYVRANCGAGDLSEWSAVASGKTLCRVNAEDAAWNFDDAATQVQSTLTTTTTYKEEQCWLYGNKMSTSYSYAPYINKNSYSSEVISTRYAYSDSCAYKFYSTTSYNGAYVVIPELIADLDTMQISFKGRAVYESYSTAAATRGQFTKYYNLYATNTYPRGIKVGTVTDPYDMSTFEELTDYQFQEVTNAVCSTKVEGDYWEDVTVSLYQAKGKFIVFLSEYNATNYAWIDNVRVEKETGLNMPTKLQLNEETLIGDYAEFTWASRAPKFEVVLKNDKDSILRTDTVTTMAYAFSALEPITNYVVEVSAMDAEGQVKSAAAKKVFKTPCMPTTMDKAKWDFKNASNAYTGSTSYLIPDCWDAGQLTKATATSLLYMPQAKQNNGNTYNYSRDKEDKTDRALQFYNYSNTYGNSYAILPELNVNMDSTALRFWVRCAQFFPADAALATNKNKAREANTNYPKELQVGVITDEADPTTFTMIDRVVYPYEILATNYDYNDESGNNYWYEVILPLKKYKDLGRIVLFYPLGTKTGYMYIDDMEVVMADFCTPITNIQAANLSSDAMDITWSIVGKDSVQLQVATTAEFDSASIVVDSILVDAEGLYQVKDLQPGQDYYARLMHFCAEDEASDWAVSEKITTYYAVRFTEKFNEVRTYPTNWSRANSKVKEVLYDSITPNPIAESITANWVRDPNTGDIAVSTGTATGSSSSSTYYNYWLITPMIDLTKLGAEDSLMLTFDAYLTNNNGNQPFNLPAIHDQLVVVVSLDGGKTFLRENATIWAVDTTDADRAYDFTGTKAIRMIDLSKYAGQNIKIAFAHSAYSELGVACSSNEMHVDNVQLNTYVKNEYAQTILEWTDYEDANFQLDADELIPSTTTTYEKYVQSTGINDDQYTILNLTVVPEIINTIADTICYGDNYMENNFEIYGATKGAEYKQKLTTISGADSTVILNLYVYAKIESTVEKTICQGDYFEFNGVKYYTNTIHTDTLISLVTGCDSLNTLYLTVNAILTGTTEEHLCPGDSVEFGKYGKIGKEGTYIDTIKNALGCDSVATLIVYTHNSDSSTTRAIILQGEKYNKGPWQGLGTAGDYPVTLQTVWGCDSVATLHLMVADVTLQVTDQIQVEDLPYIVNDTELLPVGTVEGTYVRNIEVSGQNVQLTIIVGEPTGYNNVDAEDNTIKRIEDNQLIIYKNGKRYNALGAEVR